MAGGVTYMMKQLQDKARAAADAQVNAPYQEYISRAQKAMPSIYAPAYGDISRAVAPQFTQARQMLAANPTFAASGGAQRLNRMLLQGAYGQLTDRMAGTAADVNRGGLDLLSNLIQRRVEERYRQEAEKRQKKGGIGGAIGGLVGGAAGAFGGPLLSTLGSGVGQKILR